MLDEQQDNGFFLGINVVIGGGGAALTELAN